MKRYAFVLITVLFALMPVRSALRADAPHYTVEDLGTFAGIVPTVTGINASGQVSGFVTLADHSTRAVRYTPGSGWQLPKELDIRSSAANAINASGDLAGQYTAPDGSMHAFRWRNGSNLEDIAPISGNNSQALGINDAGVVVGVSTDVSGFVAFVAAPGLPAQALPTMGGGFDFACGINNAGQITGSGFTSDFTQRAVRFEPGASALTPITSFIGDAGNSAACAIDGSGLVGGQADGPGGTMHGFRSGATLLNLTEVFGASTGSTESISEGVSVGSFQLVTSGPKHAFVHTDAKGSIDLNTVLDNGTGWVLNTASGVNASGQIVGTGTLNGTPAVFLLTKAGAEPDTTAPLISSFTASPNTVGPPNNATTPVQFSFSATDDIDPSPSCAVNSAVNTHGAPASYASVTGPLAATVVAAGGARYTFTLNCSDASGNASAATVDVVVPPDTTAPSILSLSASPSTIWPPTGLLVPVTLSVSATDDVDAAPVCTLNSISGTGATPYDYAITGPLSAKVRATSGRTYTLNVRCLDAAGNSSQAATAVVVPSDTSAPTITSISATPSAIWPPNGKWVDVRVTVTATDDVDASPNCTLQAITGGTGYDHVVTGALTANVRADRDNGGDRIYTLNVGCTDRAGNLTMGAAYVTVTKDNVGVAKALGKNK
jgi:hypothetical protein